MLNEQYRHAPLNSGFGDPCHHLATVGIKCDGYLWLTVLVKVGLGIGDRATGDNNIFLKICRTTVFSSMFKTLDGSTRRFRKGFEAELQVCGLT